MKIDTSALPKDAKFFVKCDGVELFNGLVIEHDDDIKYSSDTLVRARKYGMTPYEYGGTLQDYADQVRDSVLKPIGYQDLLMLGICADLPINEDAKAIMDEAIAKQEAKKPVTIGH